MKWTTTLLFLLATAIVVAVGAMVSRQTGRTPADFFASIEARIASGRYDKEQTLANLDIALDNATSAGDTALATQIRLVRGQILLGLGAYERARADLAAVLEARPGDRAIERLIVEIDVRAGDFAAGLARVERLTAEDPSWAEGVALLGDLHKRASQRALEDCLAIFRKTLVTDEAESATKFVLRAAAWDPDDPRRIALAHDLRPFFGVGDEPKLEAALDAAHRSAVHLAQARLVLAESLGVGFRARSFSNLLELYKRADKADLALELASTTLRMRELQEDEATIAFVISELKRQDRLRYAAELATTWTGLRRGGSPALLSECCEVLYRTRRWRPLTLAAQSLKASGDGAAELYLGLCDVAAGRARDGRFTLQRYVAGQAREPFPKARALAWREIARASRELEDFALEREALEGAVALDPDGDGALWLRLARLQLSSARGGLVQPELRWARGMSLLPDQTEALLPTWKDLGERELSANGVDLELARQAIADGRGWNPTEESSPYELWALARVYIEAGNIERASTHVRRLLSIVPGFLPGLDLELELAQKLGRVREVISLYLERLELVGPDEKSAEFGRWIPFESLVYGDLVRLMHGDPDHAGRFVVARTLAVRGEKRRALTILEQLGADSLGPDAMRLAARLHLDLGEPEAALAELVPLARSRNAIKESLDLFLEAAMACHDHKRVDQMATALAKTSEPREPEWLALADRMLAGGSAAAADRLLERLDQPPRTRSGDIVVRRAAAALGRGDLPAVESLLERAEAFETGGRAELVALFACVDDDRLIDLSAAASVLRSSSFQPNPLHAAIIDLLADRDEPAAATIAAALKADPHEPRWQLVRAAAAALAGEAWTPPAYFGDRALRQTELFLVGPDGARDPRRALCTLLALHTPLGRGWARKEVESMSGETHGDLWPGLLAALLARANDEPAVARRWIAGVLASNPGFGPAWDIAEEIPVPKTLDPRAAILMRIRRVEALGELSGTLSERLLDEARILQLRGDVAGALAVARAAAAEDPGSGEIQWKLAQLLRARGERAAAIRAYSEALQSLPAGSNLRATGELLALFEEASKASPPEIDPQAYAMELERLHSSLRNDPRVVVAQARLEMALDPLHPPLALARAYARLERFRELHATSAIDSLSPGASAAWAEFLLAVDPDRACAFVQRELELDPGALDLWVLLGHVLAAQNNIAGALAQYGFVLHLAPDHPVLAEYLWLMAGREVKKDNPRAFGARNQREPGTRIDSSQTSPLAAEYAWIATGREMEREEARALQMKTNPEVDARLTPAQRALISARASFTLGGRGVAHAIEALEMIEPRELNALEAQRYGFLFAETLIARGKPADLARARTFLDELAGSVSDPFRRDLVRALAALTSPPAPDPSRAASLR